MASKAALTAIAELHARALRNSRDKSTSGPLPRRRARIAHRGASTTVQRRLRPEEVETLIAGYRAGATALELASKHRVHRTTVLAVLERHGVSRRGRVMTEARIDRALGLYALGRSCASIGREMQVNPETIRQILLKAGVAMRSPGRSRAIPAGP